MPEPLPRGANFVRSKMLWEIGLHLAGDPTIRYGGDRDMCIVVGSGGSDTFKPKLRMATGSAIMAEDVARGAIEMAFVNPSALLTQAYRGVGIFSKKLPVRIVAMYPSWDRFVMAVHPRTGIRTVRDIKEKRYPLKLSVREDPTHSTLVLIDQLFAFYGFSLKDFQGWGGQLVLCGSPHDRRRLEPMQRGELDAVFDEGIRVWLPQALESGLVPLDPEPAALEHLAALGWRTVPLPQAKYPRLDRDHVAIDFSGWPIYCSASLPEQLAYDAAGAVAARFDEIPWEEGTTADQFLRETDATPMDVPLHPGAERWLREHAARR